MAGKPGRHWIRWNKAMRQGFLDHLAATGNVGQSAAAIGVDPRSIYNLRRRDPQFAAGWGEALALGYQMIETRLIGHVLGGGGACDPVTGEELPPINAELALRMLATERNRQAGAPYKGGPKLRRASEEETNAALMKKLDAVEKRMREAKA